nr:hypothetical protein [Halorhabdus rudnickae]
MGSVHAHALASIPNDYTVAIRTGDPCTQPRREERQGRD